jgi:hypothetical protein
MNIERMKMAIDRLNNLPEDRGRTFDYTTFLKQKDCGTVACAAGELALYPPFMEMGLYMDKYGDIYFVNTPGHNIQVLAEFLGITPDQSDTAFSTLNDTLGIYMLEVTAKHVADYLKTLLDAEKINQ